MTRVPRHALPAAFLAWLDAPMGEGRYDEIPLDRLAALADTYRLFVDPSLPAVVHSSPTGDEDADA